MLRLDPLLQQRSRMQVVSVSSAASDTWFADALGQIHNGSDDSPSAADVRLPIVLSACIFVPLIFSKGVYVVLS